MTKTLLILSLAPDLATNLPQTNANIFSGRGENRRGDDCNEPL